jgi:hypothetical protein
MVLPLAEVFGHIAAVFELNMQAHLQAKCMLVRGITTAEYAPMTWGKFYPLRIKKAQIWR